MSVVDLAYGVRAVINIICVMIKLYDKHRARCVGVFDESVIAALDVVSAGCATLAALNPPGPR